MALIFRTSILPAFDARVSQSGSGVLQSFLWCCIHQDLLAFERKMVDLKNTWVLMGTNKFLTDTVRNATHSIKVLSTAATGPFRH